MPIMQGLHFLHVRRSSTYFCRSLKREKDQLQQRLDAQQEVSVVPQASSAESELQVKGLQEQISQSEELLQVGTASGRIKKPAFIVGILASSLDKSSGCTPMFQRRNCVCFPWCWSSLCLLSNACAMAPRRAFLSDMQQPRQCYWQRRHHSPASCVSLCSTTASAIIEHIGMTVSNLSCSTPTQAAISTLVCQNGIPYREPLSTVPDLGGRHVLEQTKEQIALLPKSIYLDPFVWCRLPRRVMQKTLHDCSKIWRALNNS